MITVHHLENSRSQRVLWLLEELNLPYMVKRYERDRKTMLAPPELKAIHPLGKSPVIVDDAPSEGGFRTVAETGLIIEYLVTKASGQLGAPSDPDGALLYRYYLHYAEGSMMPPLVLKLILGRVPLFGRSAQKRIQPMIDIHLDFVELELTRRPWFSGDLFTAADVMMSFPLEAARARAGLDETRPRTMAWLEAIHARTAYQAALLRGGPYAYAYDIGG
jgi:glutathione S-transferase